MQAADVMFAGVDDPNDPFNDGARPNSWTPPLNESWVWGKNKVNGYGSWHSVILRASDHYGFLV